MDLFFPNAAFGWVFVILLTAILAVASWFDYRTVIVPKKVSLVLLAGGVLFTLVRCLWLGIDGHKAWLFHPTNAGLGLLDGVLFALSGFILAFIVFFVQWLLNIAGGGDVKLAAGLGVWVGPFLFFGVLLLTIPIVLIVLIVSYVGGLMGYNLNPASLPADPNAPKHVKRPKRRKMTFSLPLTLGVIALLLISFRYELGLQETPPPPPAAAGQPAK